MKIIFCFEPLGSDAWNLVFGIEHSIALLNCSNCGLRVPEYSAGLFRATMVLLFN